MGDMVTGLEKYHQLLNDFKLLVLDIKGLEVRMTRIHGHASDIGKDIKELISNNGEENGTTKIQKSKNRKKV